MIKGKTSSRFEFEILEEQLNNYELLESIADSIVVTAEDGTTTKTYTINFVEAV